MGLIDMNYWNDKKNVDEYIKMTEGYTGKELIEKLKKILPQGSTVLELGMGSGKDLEILNEFYTTTGTDVSKVFVEKYKEKHDNADVFVLDAITLDLDRKFDCIYSNKTLQHLKKAEFKQSLKKQKELLNPEGILFHSLWVGDTEEKYGGLLFVYYTKEKLMEIVKSDFDIVEMEMYKEEKPNDSLYIVLRKKD